MDYKKTRACFNLALNFDQESFKIIFEDSLLGWEYFWDKLMYYVSKNQSYPEAFCSLVLMLDSHHSEMLDRYIETLK